MSFIQDLFAPDVTASKPKREISETTTKLVGEPLAAAYGKPWARGNIVFKRVSSDKKTIRASVALCWGPVTINTSTIRINEKRPHYINDALNPDRNSDPGFIEDLHVWTYDGSLGQTFPSFTTPGSADPIRSDYQVKAVPTVSSGSREFTLRIGNKTWTEKQSGSLEYRYIGTGEDRSYSQVWVSSETRRTTLGRLVSRIQNDANYGTAAYTIGIADKTETRTEGSGENRTTTTYTVGEITITGKSGNTLPRITGSNFDFETFAPNPGDEEWQAHEYGMNRTSFIHVRGTANEGFSNINEVLCQLERANLLGSSPYQTAVPTVTPTRSSNPVAAALDWLCNEDYGAAIPYTRIDETSWQAAIDYCDGMVSDGQGGTEPRWSADILAGKNDDGSTHADVLGLLLSHANAAVFESNGLIKCWIARPQPSVMHLDRDIFDPDGLQTRDVMETPNIVELTYSENQGDGEERRVRWEDKNRSSLFGEITENNERPGIPNRSTASRMVSFLGRKTLLEQISLKGTGDQRLMVLEPGDVVDVTIGYADVTWYTAKKFYVDEISPDNRDGDVELSLIEYPGDFLFNDGRAATIDSSAPIYSNDPTATIVSPNQVPINPAYVTATVQQDDTLRVFTTLSWTSPPSPPYMHRNFEIYRRTSGSDGWQKIDLIGGRRTKYRDAILNPVYTEYHYAIISVTENGVEGVLPSVAHITIGPDDFITEDGYAGTLPGALTFNLTDYLYPDHRKLDLNISWTAFTYDISQYILTHRIPTAEDEAFYLANNADVQTTVNDGTYDSGFDHFVQFGEDEGRQYYVGDTEPQEISRSATTNTKITEIAPGNYTFYLYGMDQAGVIYGPVQDSLIVDPQNVSNPTATITDLELKNESAGTVFTGRDAAFTWRVNSLTHDRDWSSSDAIGWEDPHFRDFVVKIFDSATSTLMRMEYTRETTYTYTAEKNALDTQNVLLDAGGSKRAIQISVSYRDKRNTVNPATTLDVSNPAPAAPTNLTSTGTAGGASIAFDKPTVLDYAGTLVWVSDTSGFTPSGSTLVADIKGSPVWVSLASTGQAYYARVAHYDEFNQSALNISPEITLQAVDNAQDTTPPNTPSGLSVTSELRSDPETGEQHAVLIATWDTSTADDFAYWEIASRETGTTSYQYSIAGEGDFDAGGRKEWSPVKKNTSYDVRLRAVDASGNTSGWTAIVAHNTDKDTTPPGKPVGIYYTETFKHIWITYTAPADKDLSHVRVYESTVNDRSQAEIYDVPAKPGTKGTWISNNLGPGSTRYYWLSAVDTSGNESETNNSSGSMGVPMTTLSIETADYADLSIVRAKIRDLAVDDGKIYSLAASKIFVPAGDSGIPATVTVGTTGVTIGTVKTTADTAYSWSEDPLSRAAAKTTTLAPGLVTVSGTTTLGDWRHGGDLTKIEGGALAANTVTANKLRVGNRNVSIDGLDFTRDVSVTGRVNWTSGTVEVLGGAAYAVSSGSQDFAIGERRFVYWVNGATALSQSLTRGDALGDDRIHIATIQRNSRGFFINAHKGVTEIDGSAIRAGSVTADSAVLADASVETLKIAGNAATVPVVTTAYTNSDLYVNDTDGEVAVMSVTLPATDDTRTDYIHLTFTHAQTLPSDSNQFAIRIYIDGVNAYGEQSRSGELRSLSISNQTAASVTYEVRAEWLTGTDNGLDRSRIRKFHLLTLGAQR